MTWRRVSVVLSVLAGAGGVALFVWLFTKTDVLADLGALPGGLWLLVAFPAVPATLGTVSLARSFPRVAGSRIPPAAPLFTIRLAGEAVNNGLASAYVAGEPVKGLLAVSYGTRPRAGLAAALIGKTTLTAGEILFLMFGVALAAVRFGGEAPLVGVLLPVTAGGVAVVVLGVVVQQRRLIGGTARLLRAVRLAPRALWDRALPGADAVDDAIRAYYRDQRRDFVAASSWAALGWLAGAAELWAFLAVTTDLEDPLLLAVVLEAGVAVVKGLSFFVPASIGAQEGGIVWLFQSVGASAPGGIAYAVFRRFREVVWIGLGFLALGWHLRRVGRPRPLQAAP